MMNVEFLNLSLPDLTGDAVKLAVHLIVLGAGPIRADKAWEKGIAKKIGLTSAGVHKAVRELAKSHLVELVGRTQLGPYDGSSSHGGRSLARSSAPTFAPRLAALDASDVDDSPPWDRVDERSETTSRNAVVCSPHADVVAGFDKMYVDKYGTKPTWGGKQGSIVKSLLKCHSPSEILRRAQIMFGEERRWPAGPYDLGTLSAHFDKFAVAKARGGIVGDARKTGAGYFGAVDDV